MSCHRQASHPLLKLIPPTTTVTVNVIILSRCQRLIPPLSPNLHKGQAGRIAVVGGSKDYSGAPFFASMTTLRLFRNHTQDIVKTYSPDLIVHTDLVEDSYVTSERRDGNETNPSSPTRFHPVFAIHRTEESLTNLFESLLPRLHVLVIGPGLGRSEHMQLAARTAISLAREKGLFIIIDADGLWLVQTDPDVIKGYPKAVLTPNVVEFKRLCKAVNIDTDNDSSSDPSKLAGRLATALGGVTILEKGAVDRIANDEKEEAWTNETQGSLRRCGGQGDVLSGAVGCFLAWGLSYVQRQEGGEEGGDKSDPITETEIPRLAAYAASTITRTASRLTFEKKKRAMQTSDMLGFVGDAFEEVFPEMVVEQQTEGSEEREGKKIRSKV
ncbi:BQ2448_7216 [Microbotryum intermedium]|uniref:ATP-dependent (S)-NAD(P)H-hydrate dehydratase n=1 Tax=Microbotryum intermedium TaxID=269621 RepID=A0A238FHJ8_9BASI|nr:BQ2448_7216 [Microbotryum intermedium]